jgi:hypothetical protein
VTLLINCFIFIAILGLDFYFNVALLVLFILPPPFMVSLFISQDREEDQIYVDNIISLAIISAIILFILLAFIYN